MPHALIKGGVLLSQKLFSYILKESLRWQNIERAVFLTRQIYTSEKQCPPPLNVKQHLLDLGVGLAF